jgi:hypothetical protein
MQFSATKNQINVILISLVVIFLFLINIFALYNFSSKLKSYNPNLQTVDLPDCGISIQFPKEISGIPILAYREPFSSIHSGPENMITGITDGKDGVLIGNPHLNYKDKTQNFSISCRKKLLNETYSHNSQKISNSEFKKLTNWDLANNVSDIHKSGIDNDFLGTIAKITNKTGIGYQNSLAFVFEDNLISTNQVFANFPVVGFWGNTGILPTSINILPINQVKANTQINQKVWEYTEKNIKIETKDINFEILVGDKTLIYTDKYIWKTKNGQKLEDSSSYVQTKISFVGQEIASSTSYYHDFYDNGLNGNKFGKPLYKSTVQVFDNQYILTLKFQDNKIVVKSEDKGQTWSKE